MMRIVTYSAIIKRIMTYLLIYNLKKKHDSYYEILAELGQKYLSN